MDDQALLNTGSVSITGKYQDKDFIVWRMKYVNGLVLPPQNEKNLTFSRVGISFCFKTSLGTILFDVNRDGEDFDFLMKLKELTNNWVIAPEIYYNVRH
jgi:hypothetical protein